MNRIPDFTKPWRHVENEMMAGVEDSILSEMRQRPYTYSTKSRSWYEATRQTCWWPKHCKACEHVPKNVITSLMQNIADILIQKGYKAMVTDTSPTGLHLEIDWTGHYNPLQMIPN